VVKSMIFNQRSIAVSLKVRANKWYRLQLLIPEQCCSRSLQILINDDIVLTGENILKLSKIEGVVVVTAEFDVKSNDIDIVITNTNENDSNGVHLAGIVLREFIPADEEIAFSPYSASAAMDNFVLNYQKDALALFQETSKDEVSLTWTISDFIFGTYTIDFRYASDHNVNFKIFVDGNFVKSVDLPATKDLHTFMRNNFVLNDYIFTRGDHKVTITKTKGQDFTGPFVHRINVCSSDFATRLGCSVHKFVNPLVCYSQMIDRVMSIPIDKTPNQYTILDEALSDCSSRNDCGGVQESKTGFTLVSGGVGIAPKGGAVLHKKRIFF